MPDSELDCPLCHVVLAKTNGGFGFLWTCPQCDGRSVSLSLLRRGIEADFLNRLWHAARENEAGGKRGNRPCPSCRKAMPCVILPETESENLVIDVCPACQFLWLDAGETAKLPVKEMVRPEKKPGLSPEAREAVAMLQVESIRDQANRDSQNDWVDELLKERPLHYLIEVIIREIIRHLR